MIKIDGVQIVINSVYERGLRQELLDKAFFLLSCIKGTIPMNRNIGLDPDKFTTHYTPFFIFMQ